MAKRRNAKKEKAIRNKLNARKFRKASTRRTGRYRRYQDNTDENKSNENSGNSENSQNNQSEKTQAGQSASTQTRSQTEKVQPRSSVPKPNISSGAKPSTAENTVTTT
ncbi:hypothetical protein Xen7305DRAFT_00013320 [Xenococcus sp. PCC 7305]|uniref:hypothetical protein n=1 Tax=Xenococcus sp. PCC 7305 TaxID=102125 RepID=UPI0002ACE2FC|nr:hypothetical protein [Xenococcus sp. PCC 7305]ELS01627.1 hypothetical protein Xen7305DRAFT_00013320 [Xenococcus sp. PCC 7305]